MTSDKVLAYETNFTGTTDGWTAGWSAAGTIYSATPPTNVAQNNNRLQCTATVSMGGVRKVINTTIGVSYTLSMDIDMGTAEGLYIMPRTTNGSNEFTGTNLAQVYLTSSGTYAVNFTATTSTTQLLVEKAGSVEKYFFIDNVKVEQSTPTLSSYPIADVVGAQYYYPYHSTMKSFTAGENLDYPFGGANGQEKDNEIFNGAYGALFWEYDSRLGGNGRWNVDPKTHPSFSPYSTFFNNPIYYSDEYGDSSEYYDSKGNKLHTSHDKLPNAVVVIPDNRLQQFKQGLEIAKQIAGDNKKILDGSGLNGLFRSMGISYPIDDYWSFYDESEKNVHDESMMRRSPEGSGKLINETGIRLILKDAMMVRDPTHKPVIGDPNGVVFEPADGKMHTHPNEGVRVYNKYKNGSETIGAGVYGHSDDIFFTKQKAGTGTMDVGVTKTQIRLFNSDGVKIILIRGQLFKK